MLRDGCPEIVRYEILWNSAIELKRMCDSCDKGRDFFIRENFSHTNVLTAEKEREDGSRQYNVRLADGTEMEFDAKGNWKSIECEFSLLPEAALLPVISEYIASNYPGAKAYKIDRKFGGYEVDIAPAAGQTPAAGDIELIFNAFGEFVRESR